MTLEIYVVIAIIFWPALGGLAAWTWWKEIDRPRAPTIEGMAWGVIVGLAAALVWPLTLLVLVMWGLGRLLWLAAGWATD